jgi:predicted TIM-barrel fold metal-dependent hydrolase
MQTDRDILDAVEMIQVIDTHEHLEEESERLKQKLDFFSIFRDNAVSDLVSAGMSDENLKKCSSPETPLDEKWRLFEPVYLAARNTGFMRAARLSIRDLYGIENLNASNYSILTDNIRDHNMPGVNRWILRDRCSIRLAQVNALESTFFRERTDADLFLQDLSLARLLQSPPPVDALERETSSRIGNLKAYGDAIGKLFERIAPLAVAAKQQSAYWRAQSFADVPEADAARLFDAAIRDPATVPAGGQKALQDWTFNHCVRLCVAHDLPIKIHVGYAAGNNGMDPDLLRPDPLAGLLRRHPKARFSLLHIAYPWQEDLLALAKHFRNVHVDMCWAWILDPQAARRFLKQFLTAVPANKLFGFGGDYGIADPVYGHLLIARQGIARGLSELVEEQYFGRDEAVAMAHRILHDNAAVFFRVDQKSDALARAQRAKKS